uniref:Beta-1,4-galactosyltransferase n=1 Tax=Myripristis murdjan TaxID=586833 RepID=A0A667YR19_9TELE
MSRKTCLVALVSSTSVVFICLFTLVCVIAVLLYTSSDPILLKNLRHMMITEKKGTSANLSKSLQPCPDVPPKLVGPLFITFDQHRTMDGVKKDVGSSLQEGGRFKPPNCLSLQKVAVIIPFRKRHEHLKHWLFYLHPVLKRQQLDYGIYVINQDGEGVFNRGKLANVGFVEALKEYDYDCFVFSDVDLVPMNDHNLYRCFNKPRHLSVAIDKFNFMLPHPTVFGGVSSLSKDQFLKVNGYSNNYWGWGGEDDDLSQRISLHGMGISRPDSETGKYKMIGHDQDLNLNFEAAERLEETAATMDKDGLNSLNYTVKKIEKDRLYTLISVDIHAPQELNADGLKMTTQHGL